MNVKGKYLKDEEEQIFSPVVNNKSVFDNDGKTIAEGIGNDLETVLNKINGTSVVGAIQNSKNVTEQELKDLEEKLAAFLAQSTWST